MTTIHIGHHFFGAGNLGDDFMLAGFLSARNKQDKVVLTCCVPYPREPLARRFPEVTWLPYDEETRRNSIERCDAWLGLGGSPFQISVSSWFSDHLEAEARWCAAAGKPMYFLGVGGQDVAAYDVPALRSAAEQAVMIWTRDSTTAEALALSVAGSRVRVAADLAHVFFEANPPPHPVPGRIAAVLNFDYAEWPQLGAVLASLASIPAKDRVWLAQETRPLPGGERWLYDRLSVEEKKRWRFEEADRPATDLFRTLSHWPSAEWTLTSRYHATLVAAWAGSHAVVVVTNEKLRGVARECGYPMLGPETDPSGLVSLLRSSVPPKQSDLLRFAAAARQACTEFWAAVSA